MYFSIHHVHLLLSTYCQTQSDTNKTSNKSIHSSEQRVEIVKVQMWVLWSWLAHLLICEVKPLVALLSSPLWLQMTHSGQVLCQTQLSCRDFYFFSLPLTPTPPRHAPLCFHTNVLLPAPRHKLNKVVHLEILQRHRTQSTWNLVRLKIPPNLSKLKQLVAILGHESTKFSKIRPVQNTLWAETSWYSKLHIGAVSFQDSTIVKKQNKTKP